MSGGRGTLRGSGIHWGLGTSPWGGGYCGTERDCAWRWALRQVIKVREVAEEASTQPVRCVCKRRSQDTAEGQCVRTRERCWASGKSSEMQRTPWPPPSASRVGDTHCVDARAVPGGVALWGEPGRSEPRAHRVALPASLRGILLLQGDSPHQ